MEVRSLIFVMKGLRWHDWIDGWGNLDDEEGRESEKKGTGRSGIEYPGVWVYLGGLKKGFVKGVMMIPSELISHLQAWGPGG